SLRRVPAPSSPCSTRYCIISLSVSISDEMPGPWGVLMAGYTVTVPFVVSISDEMPGPWRLPHIDRLGGWLHGFNLRRDARPLATSYCGGCRSWLSLFQSQTRCQAPGDISFSKLESLGSSVSISDEMPGPWRPIAHAH